MVNLLEWLISHNWNWFINHSWNSFFHSRSFNPPGSKKHQIWAEALSIPDPHGQWDSCCWSKWTPNILDFLLGNRFNIQQPREDPWTSPQGPGCHPAPATGLWLCAALGKWHLRSGPWSEGPPPEELPAFCGEDHSQDGAGAGWMAPQKSEAKN